VHHKTHNFYWALLAVLLVGALPERRSGRCGRLGAELGRL